MMAKNLRTKVFAKRKGRHSPPPGLVSHKSFASLLHSWVPFILSLHPWDLFIRGFFFSFAALLFVGQTGNINDPEKR